MAVAVALLMIGGEFDLSAGVAVTTSALIASMFSYQLTANVWVGVVVSLLVTLVIGFFNGYLVVKTGIPSFLVTLGTFFMLRGLNLAVTKLITGNVSTDDVQNMDGFASAKKVFASSFTIGDVTIRITLLWWILFVVLATWILLRTHLGNWIFAVGGSDTSARAVGVPVNKVKIGLFMGVALHGLVLRHAPAVRVQHGAVRRGRRQRVHLHHRRRHRRLSAHRRVRLRRSARRSAPSSSA